MSRQYLLQEHCPPDTEIRHFEINIKEDDISLIWDWPIAREIRLILVFKSLNDAPDIKTLLSSHHHHEVVVRDLASHFTDKLTEEPCKYLLAPAYFDPDKNIVVCSQVLLTDWVYKKTPLYPTAVYSPISLGAYKKAVISVNAENGVDMPEDALFYTIVDKATNQRLGPYAIDDTILDAGGYVYLSKSQYIEFHVTKKYASTIEIASLNEGE